MTAEYITWKLSKSPRSPIVILSKEELAQHLIIARVKVSKGTVHGTLTCFVETRSFVIKARSGRPKLTAPSGDTVIEHCA